MLLVVEPSTLVLPSVGPIEDAVAVLLIPLEGADIESAIFPRISTSSSYLVVMPHPLKLSTISPAVLAYSLQVVMDKTAFVCSPIGPLELALSVFIPESVFTFVCCPVWPCFNTRAVLFVVEPISFVALPISVEIPAITHGLAELPVSFIDISVGICESALAVASILFP